MRLKKLLDDGNIGREHASKFFRSVRAFYEKAMEYSLANLPLKDDLLRNAKVLEFNFRENASLQQLQYFIHRLEILFPASFSLVDILWQILVL